MVGKRRGEGRRNRDKKSNGERIGRLEGKVKRAIRGLNRQRQCSQLLRGYYKLGSPENVSSHSK